MKVSEKVAVKGIVHLVVRERGQVIKEITEENLVLTYGRAWLAAFLADPNSSEGLSIANMKFGTDGTEPTLTDNSIDNAVTCAFITRTVSGRTATFTFSMGNGVGAGQTYREMALCMSNGNLFARKTFAGIPKTSEIAIDGTWTITF